MSADSLPELARGFNSYATHVAHLLAQQVDPALADQVVAIVAGLEAALRRQARDEIDVELRLTAMEENVITRLEALAALLEDKTQ